MFIYRMAIKYVFLKTITSITLEELVYNNRDQGEVDFKDTILGKVSAQIKRKSNSLVEYDKFSL